MTRIVACTTLTLVLLIAGCSGSDNIGPTNPSSGNGAPAPSAPSTGPTALFVPLSGVLPYPNDAYFSGSTDGTLNMPPSAFAPVTFRISDTAAAEPVMNALDGFSTTAAMSARFDAPIDPTSLTPASVVVIQVTTDPATKGVTGAVGALVPGTDYSATVDPASGNTTVQIRPLRPLAPKSSYLVLLTKGIKGTTGGAASADADYGNISSTILTEFSLRSPTAPPAPAQCVAISNATLNGLCRLTSTHFLVARGAGLDPSTIIVSFSFSTQSISDTLDRLNAAATAATATLTQTPFTTGNLVPGSPGLARIYVGALQIPYYLTPASSATDNAPLTRYWVADPAQTILAPPGAIDPASPLVTRFKPLPAVKATLTIPLLVTAPVGGCSAGGGCPVAIFQHGITRSRGDSLLVADMLAGRGFATVAIDLPLHGITPTDLFAPLRQAGLTERTFDLDLVSASGAPGSDGTIDPSGTHFINLSNVLVSRDNLRQAVSDLIVLTRTIPTLDINGDTMPDFNANRIHYIGYSLGAIVGMSFLGVNSDVRSSALPFGGVNLTAILTQSASLSPRINAGLAAVNAALQPNTPLYNTFFRDAQTAVDAADPVNYAARAVQLPTATPRNVHMFILVGGAPNPAGGNWPSDTVVPSSTGLSAATLMGLDVFTAGGTITGNGAQLRLNAGDHGSYINPTINGPVTNEMQTSIANFLLSDGAQVSVTNPTLLSP